MKTKLLQKVLSLVVILIGFFAGSSLSQAALIAYEGFDYTAPTADIGALPGSGTGFTGDWSSGTPPFAVSSGSLVYTGTAALASSGNQVGLNTGGDFLYTDTNRALGSEITSGDVWVSWLYNSSNTGGDNTYSVLRLTRFGTGITAVGDPGSNSNDQRLELSAGGQQVFGSDLVDSQTYLFTLRITGINTGGNTSFDLFVDDNLTTPALSISGATFDGFDGVALLTGNNVGGNIAAFDEIRIGTTLGDVAVVPEPSTWALLLIGLALLMFVVRRRHATRLG